MRKLVWFFMLIVIGVSSCEDTENKNPLNKLISFSLKEINVEFKIDENIVSAIANSGTNLTDLTLEYEISNGATLIIGDKVQKSGVSKHDFSNQVNMKVVSKDGIQNLYSVIIGKLPNKQPQADAGENQTVFSNKNTRFRTIMLDASASKDDDGEIVSFVWSIEGEEIANGKTIEVTLGVGRHIINLTVEDNLGSTDTDEIVVVVKEFIDFNPVNPNAMEETRNLLINLGEIAHSEKFIFGQEFPLSFKLGGIRHDLNSSDSKDIVGDHPGVFGIDPHYILYKTKQEAQTHIDEAKLAYENGGVVTFDFHQQSRYNNSIYMDEISDPRDKRLMYDIVNDVNDSRDWFYGEINQIIKIINEDLGFPVVFRLFHEMNGGWFWWGNKATNHTQQLYIDFFRMTVDYIRNRSNLVLFSWSPNESLNKSYYPGNDYVDVVGVDLYEPSAGQVTRVLKELSLFAAENNKVAAFTETGYRNNYVINKSSFWTTEILKGINDGGEDIQIAWVLAWFNAPWHSSQSELFIPDLNSPSAAKNDFIKFYNDDLTLFLKEVKAAKVYE